MATDTDFKAKLGAARLRARLKKMLEQQREVAAAAEAAQEAATCWGEHMMIGTEIAEICRDFDIAVEFDSYSTTGDDDGVTLIEVFHTEDGYYALEAAAEMAAARVSWLEEILADPAMTEDDIKRALIRTYGLDENWALRKRLADALWDPSKLPPEPEPLEPASVVDMRQWRWRNRRRT